MASKAKMDRAATRSITLPRYAVPCHAVPRPAPPGPATPRTGTPSHASACPLNLA
jgi:hypothetical protein